MIWVRLCTARMKFTCEGNQENHEVLFQEIFEIRKNGVVEYTLQ